MKRLASSPEEASLREALAGPVRGRAYGTRVNGPCSKMNLTATASASVGGSPTSFNVKPFDVGVTVYPVKPHAAQSSWTTSMSPANEYVPPDPTSVRLSSV